MANHRHRLNPPANGAALLGGGLPLQRDAPPARTKWRFNYGTPRELHRTLVRWHLIYVETYVLTREGVTRRELQAKLPSLVQRVISVGARRLCRQSSPAPAEWRQRFDALRRRMRVSRPVRVLESAEIDVPMVIGGLRPVVLVPMEALTGLSAQQLELILAHELAHIRRHDHLVNLLQTVAEIVLFYHPAVWWLSEQVRVERENCCDDLAVELCGDPLPYAKALLELESLRVSYPQLALAASGGSLHERILRLVHPESACAERWISGAPLFGVVALLVVAAPLAVSAQLGAVADAAGSAASADPFAGPAPAPRPAPLPPGMAEAPLPMLAPIGPPVQPLAPARPPAPSPLLGTGLPASASSATPGGQRDTLDVDDLIAMRIHRVTPEFIRELGRLGYHAATAPSRAAGSLAARWRCSRGSATASRRRGWPRRSTVGETGVETHRGRIKQKLGLKTTAEFMQQTVLWVHLRSSQSSLAMTGVVGGRGQSPSA